jgi:hypothetical protein
MTIMAVFLAIIMVLHIGHYDGYHHKLILAIIMVITLTIVTAVTLVLIFAFIIYSLRLNRLNQPARMKGNQFIIEGRHLKLGKKIANVSKKRPV